MPNPVYTAFQTAASEQTQQWVIPYAPPGEDTAHQFVLFIKPEATNVEDGVNLEGILSMVMERLTAFETTVHAIRILPAAYLKSHSVMAQHYGVINKISREGESALTEAARDRLHEEFADDITGGAKILGGHQFLEVEPEISPLGLSAMNDNIGTTKLGGGSYCMRLNLLGQVYLLLNPFHAYQLVPYTTGNRAIIVMECRSNRDWAALRSELTGSTNPATAADGSIRAELLSRKEEFGLKDVNQGLNGIHLSAGPLEGMVELQRFFTDPDHDHVLDWSETRFGHQLIDAGHSAEAVCGLAENPELKKDGETISAFDLTEEINAAEALERLA